MPCRDDTNKIKIFLKKGYSDKEIMKCFGIRNCTLQEIKSGLYDPAKHIYFIQD